MANNDDYDPWDPQTYAPGQAAPPPQPQYPTEPGTTSALGMGADDPLRDWAKQLTPDQLQTFSAHHAMGDPESAKQSLIDSGVPPPNHHYDSQGRPFYPTDAFGTTQISSGGEVSQTPQQQVSQAVRGAQQPQAPSLGVASGLDPNAPESKPPLPATRAVPAQPPAEPPSGGPIGVGPPTGPLAPVIQNAPTPSEAKGAIQERFKKFSPTPPPPKQDAPVPAPTPAPAPEPAPARAEPPREGAPSERVPLPRERPKEADKTWMEKTGEGLSDLSKSLEGVKAPPRPPFPSIGAVAPRGPVGLHPQIQHLLSLVGQNPAAAQGLIQRIAGVGRF